MYNTCLIKKKKVSRLRHCESLTHATVSNSVNLCTMEVLTWHAILLVTGLWTPDQRHKCFPTLLSFFKGAAFRYFCCLWNCLPTKHIVKVAFLHVYNVFFGKQVDLSSSLYSFVCLCYSIDTAPRDVFPFLLHPSCLQVDPCTYCRYSSEPEVSLNLVGILLTFWTNNLQVSTLFSFFIRLICV